MSMPRRANKIDRWFLGATLLLVLVGFLLFSSASLGLLARDGLRFSDVAFSQLVLGIGGGLIALSILAHVHYRVYKRFAPHLFLAALFVTALVFVPGVGIELNGAHRWLNVAGVSFQPGELLKLSFLIVVAWYYSTYHTKLRDIRYALGGVLGTLALAGTLLMLQPDTGTFVIMVAAGGAMVLAAGVRIQHLALLAGLAILGLAVIAFSRPYLLDRVTTFLDPAGDPSGAGYQIKQSLIAVGSGGVVGRGFGQSVQKFSYLPEPMSDSIFSVAAEEFGFLGSVGIVVLYVFFAVRGLLIAARAPDRFGGLLAVGIVILIVTQSFINIGAMVGILPLTGEPLVFMSQGGTSLLFALAGVGIVLNVSRYAKTTRRLR